MAARAMSKSPLKKSTSKALQPYNEKPSTVPSANPLEGIIDLLNTVAGLAKNVLEPVNSITDGLRSANSVVIDIEEVINGVNDVLKVAQLISDVCPLLSEIPPPVGEIIVGLGEALETFANATGELLTPLKKFQREVLDEAKEALGKILKVCLKVDSALNFVATKVPQWINTVQVLYFGWQVVSALVSLLQGTEPAQRLQDLLHKFGDIGDAVKLSFHQLC